MNFYERYNIAWTSNSTRHIATPSPFARTTYFYVQEIGYFKTLSSYFTERSHLASYLLIYVLSGKGTLKYQNKTYSIKKGNLIWIDCMLPHYYDSFSKEPLEILWVHFNGSTTKGYYEQFSRLSPPINTPSEGSKIKKMLKEMLKLHQNNSMQKELLCSNYLLTCMVEILTDLGPSRETQSYPELIRDVNRYIDNHFNEKITLDFLAQKFGVSKYYLIRLFKKYTDFSPIDYLITRRITYAKELLRFTNMSVTEISNAVGIENISHFIKLFKEREELTPLSYKKKWMD
ncbi:MAG: AraC family transcriptional regulator [Eubacteriales bacterium]